MKLLNTGSCKQCHNSLAGLRVQAIYCGARCRRINIKKRIRARRGGFVRGASRQCIECGMSFMPISNRHVFCTDGCTRSAYTKRIATEKPLRHCIVCNEEFSHNSSMHRICSDKCIRVHRRHVRLASYGLTPQDFEEILRQQGGGCAICQTKDTERWAIDHDHACCQNNKTCGKCIRGILCFPCNQALGLFKDSAENIARALNYIAHSNSPGQEGSRF